MKRTLGIILLVVTVCSCAFHYYAGFVLPKTIVRCKELGLELSALQKTLFSVGQLLQSRWIVTIPLTLVLMGAAIVMIARGGDED